MATEQQLPKLLGAIVEHQGAFASLPKEDAQWVILNTKEAIALAMEAWKNRAKATVTTAVETVIELLLDLIGTVSVPATTEKFVARDKFVVGTGRKATVKISGVWDNFQLWFLGKIEEPIGEQTLRYAKLRKSSVGTPIIKELGGEAKAETTLTEIYSLMAKQPKGEKGALLTNGWANIFYLKDVNNVLRTVVVLWLVGGWLVDAFEVSRPTSWLGGFQVFSRNSVLESSVTGASAS